MKMRHPTLDMPIIDYDLALLFQPMLMLGISIGVIFNVVFADWMVTILLIVLFIGNSVVASPCDSALLQERVSGGVGISNMVQKIEHHEYMGFENLCKYQVNQPSVPNRVTANDDMHVNCRTFKQAWRTSESPVKRRRHPIVLSRGIAVVGMQDEGNWNQA
ncbi:hypothetical protein GW17_00012116 [Ensete ventricosum]|uniref:Uncharacterized protein n=1 Tax=Ensete ventricosum TaxID=4639 RepID=A0A444FM19_ENSVE|nr:hypothetical protein GW17_00012116 [Ensete ventricosum]RZR71315.1 hypothetical protein BHM03_00004604 [Ensete ventricosum]